jgi:hypothetical protein
VLDESGVDVACLTVVMERGRTIPRGDCSLLYILLGTRQTGSRTSKSLRGWTSCAWASALRLYDMMMNSFN